MSNCSILVKMNNPYNFEPLLRLFFLWFLSFLDFILENIIFLLKNAGFSQGALRIICLCLSTFTYPGGFVWWEQTPGFSFLLCLRGMCQKLYYGCIPKTRDKSLKQFGMQPKYFFHIPLRQTTKIKKGVLVPTYKFVGVCKVLKDIKNPYCVKRLVENRSVLKPKDDSL